MLQARVTRCARKPHRCWRLQRGLIAEAEKGLSPMEKPASFYNRQKINPRASKELLQIQNGKLMKSSFFSLWLQVVMVLSDRNYSRKLTIGFHSSIFHSQLGHCRLKHTTMERE